MKKDRSNENLNNDIAVLNLPAEIELLLRMAEIDNINELIECSKEELLDELVNKEYLQILETALNSIDITYVQNNGLGEWFYNGNENDLI